MSVQILSSDETVLETLLSATIIHRDDKTVIMLLNSGLLSDEQDALLETDGLFIGAGVDEPMIKTKQHTIQTDGGAPSGIFHGQYVVTFEI